MKDDYFDSGLKERKGIGFLGVLAIIIIVALISGIATYAFLLKQNKAPQNSENTAQVQTEEKKEEKNNSDSAEEKENKPVVNGNEKYSVDNTTFSKIYNENKDSVVILRGYTVSGNEEVLSCMGSGFVFKEDGYILTNSHIVADVNKITVEFYDGTTVDSEIVGFDERTEVAVIKVTVDKKLKPVKLGDSDKTSIGEYAIAIGHPMGYTYSLTVGIVSGIHRNVENNNYTYKMIQIDTPINSGNSGGPLFNIEGEVIGITTLKESTSILSGKTVEGMGFAITVNTAKDVAEQFIKNGKVSRAGINATIGNMFDQQGNPVGVRVTEMTPEGAAEKAGLQINDVIVEFNGVKITRIAEIMAEIDKCSVGDEIDCKIVRSGVEMNIKITLGEL